jgi:hypothetical protein
MKQTLTEKLTVAQLVKNFHIFYENLKFFKVSTKVRALDPILGQMNPLLFVCTCVKAGSLP